MQRACHRTWRVGYCKPIIGPIVVKGHANRSGKLRGQMPQIPRRLRRAHLQELKAAQAVRDAAEQAESKGKGGKGGKAKDVKAKAGRLVGFVFGVETS